MGFVFHLVWCFFVLVGCGFIYLFLSLTFLVLPFYHCICDVFWFLYARFYYTRKVFGVPVMLGCMGSGRSIAIIILNPFSKRLERLTSGAFKTQDIGGVVFSILLERPEMVGHITAIKWASNGVRWATKNQRMPGFSVFCDDLVLSSSKIIQTMHQGQLPLFSSGSLNFRISFVVFPVIIMINASFAVDCSRVCFMVVYVLYEKLSTVSPSRSLPATPNCLINWVITIMDL